MQSLRNLANATPDSLCQHLLSTVQRLLRRLEREDVLDDLAEVRKLLEALPLATGEFGTATNRLRNAHRYLISNERGAARYELRMLTGSLRIQLRSAT